MAVVGAVFLLGAAVRGWFMLEYRPAFLGYTDAWAYVSAAHNWLFQHPLNPAGYPLFLRILHALSPHLSFTILVQHLLGIASAALLYLAVVRITGSRWLALIPAVVVLFSGLQLFLEHTLLTETLFTFLLSAAVYAGTRFLDGAWWWAAAAGALASLSGLVRGQGLLFVPVVVLCIAVGASGPWRRRGAVIAAAGLAAAVPLAGYLAVAKASTGEAAISRASGRALYSRVAPFADCGRISPPADLRDLCERTPVAKRQGTNFYLWDGSSPAGRKFGGPPAGDQQLARFARATILAQPGDYLTAVGRDLLHFAFRPSGEGASGWVTLADDHSVEAMVEPHVTSYYHTRAGFTRPGAGPLEGYGRAVELDGVAMAFLLVFPLLSVLLVRGRNRWAVVLLVGAGLVPLVASAAMANYDPRYASPAAGPLAAAVAVGIAAVAARLKPMIGRRRGLPAVQAAGG